MSKSDQEIKGCPWCDEQPEFSEIDSPRGKVYFIECTNDKCPAHTASCTGDHFKQSAINKWNTRPTPPLEAQQGEDEPLLNPVDLCRRYMNERPEEWDLIMKEIGYSRPSQSASREIKWPKRMCPIHRVSPHPEADIGDCECEEVIVFEKAVELCKKAVAESSQSVGMVPKVTGETSDGYHTFNELYDHRVLLWINLCLLQHPKIPYLVENHFDGWFLLGIETPHGQLSYHCPNKYLHLVEGIERRHPEFDGHTSNDVLKRLETIAKTYKPNAGRQG